MYDLGKPTEVGFDLLPTKTCFDDCMEWLEAEAKRGEPLDGWLLCHGLMDHDGQEYSHAWLERGDKAFDFHLLGTAKVMSQWKLEDYLDEHKPRGVTRYTPIAAVEENLRTGHFGPWKEEYRKWCRRMTDLSEKYQKEAWGPGPWQDEADRCEWRYDGFPCLIVRGSVGALCGYVAVPPGHPWHGAHCDSVDVAVHGGLTYSGRCGGNICHEPMPGESHDAYWLGFDCAHFGDVLPALARVDGRPFFDGMTYKDMRFVIVEVEKLARQAKTAADNASKLVAPRVEL